MARAPVSKTGGWGFESLHSCQRPRYSEICTYCPSISSPTSSAVEHC
jgi:hypothetical protein